MHINKKLQKARTANIQIKGLTQTYGLASTLIRRIQIVVIQFIALYRAKLWWRVQKNQETTIQKLLNQQRRAITDIYPSTPIHPLLSKAGLISAKFLLDFRQKSYVYQLLTLPKYHPTKQILLIILREGDENSQPGEQPEDTLMWVESAKRKVFGHLLAQQLVSNNAIDRVDGIKPVQDLGLNTGFGGIVIKEKKKAVEEGKKHGTGHVFEHDHKSIVNVFSKVSVKRSTNLILNLLAVLWVNRSIVCILTELTLYYIYYGSEAIFSIKLDVSSWQILP